MTDQALNVQLSQATESDSASGQEPIGQIAELTGVGTVVRQGVGPLTLQVGDPVFQNDVVATLEDARLSIEFVDGTLFLLENEAEMILDRVIFDPERESPSFITTLVKGLFVFATGQIAEEGEMEVKTPSGVIGIRGTTVGVEIVALTGETRITNLRDPVTGEVGRFEFANDGGRTFFDGENQSLSVIDARAAHGDLFISPSDGIERIYGPILRSLERGLRQRAETDQESSSVAFAQNEGDPDALRPPPGELEGPGGQTLESPEGTLEANDGPARAEPPLSEGSGFSASQEADMVALSSADSVADSDSGLMAFNPSLIGSNSTELTSTPPLAGSDPPPELIVIYRWTDSGIPMEWFDSANWDQATTPPIDSWVEIGSSAAGVVYDPLDPLFAQSLSRLTIEGATNLKVRDGKLGTRDALVVGSSSGLAVEGGEFGLLSGSAAIHGTLLVDGGTFSITSGSFVNSGQMDVTTTGHLLVLGGNFVNQGHLIANGTLDFHHGTVLQNAGALTPGAAVGSATINGTFSQLPSGSLQIHLSGAGQDNLIVLGDAHLGGTLDLLADGSFVPAAGSVFTILSASNVFGLFSGITGQILSASLEVKVSYSGNLIQLIASDRPSPGNDQIFGTEQFDDLRGLQGDDSLFALGGDDWLEGGDGIDFIDGGAGIDTLTFASSPSGVIANLSGVTELGVAPGQATDGFGNTDILANIEWLDGSGFDDSLFGDAGQNLLDGHFGQDDLTGNGGSDIFVLRAGDGGNVLGLADVISDFQDGVDLLGLSDGLALSDLTIAGDGSGNTIISVTGSGEFLSLLSLVSPASIDSSDFIVL